MSVQTSESAKTEEHKSFDIGEFPQEEFDPFRDAHKLIEILQCIKCERIFREPTTMSCGNTLCHRCAMQASIASSPSLKCPFPNCWRNHTSTELKIDVLLSKIIAIIQTELVLLTRRANQTIVQDMVYSTEICLDGQSCLGRFAALFWQAERGLLRLPHDENVIPLEQSTTPGTTGSDQGTLDLETFNHLKPLVRPELECHICYLVFYEPITTECGHTFCKNCLQRAMEQNPLCPLCRFPLVPEYQCNRVIFNLLNYLVPALAHQRREHVADETTFSNPNERFVPVFICTLAFPQLPMFLHIFEPRYRLMLRRALETDRKFGMVLPSREPGVPGLQFGTMLQIRNVETFDDGRSLIETIGTYRFKIVEWGTRDEYATGRIELVNDISPEEQQVLEDQELQQYSGVVYSDADEDGDYKWLEDRPMDSIPSSQLIELVRQFVHKLQSTESWRNHVADQRPQTQDPPLDRPDELTFWVANILPTHEYERYRLLGTTTSRERLKIVVEWLKELQNLIPQALLFIY
ncbi:LON peptidase N-terminal domain and RING finger protein [Neolecta irregularis DAH-3]|uniref:LON peptidase N-terminal domain and RING finger protein n=1 Tax=Neolecta irregularis (strain DAH-3) TaxID=1198029 RepID=A0A1U7LVC8_NEOID|nr:LON peptidase N-terminal domain and RING finger protein [Neolecta irregularis DAH-3]|eukprot:OLL26636.1 LON peptidase N-terminal domain and RING finger protein [Neolecta irregularis DAH-3]